MAVHYALVNYIIVDCGIYEIKPDRDKVKEEYPNIRLILDQAYRLVSMDETYIAA